MKTLGTIGGLLFLGYIIYSGFKWLIAMWYLMKGNDEFEGEL